MLELHAIFIGRVQGVGFRYKVKHYAERLGLVGIVKNLADGNVELIAQGKKDILEKLIYLLENEGFPNHIIEKKITFSHPKDSYSSFFIG